MANDNVGDSGNSGHGGPGNGGPGHGGGQPPVTFTIDGVSYTLQERRQTAAALLRLAGVDPAENDLARLGEHGEQRRFADTDEIQITPGERFVTIFTGSIPVA